MLREFGTTCQIKGNLPEALKSFRAGLDIADRLAKADPGNAGRQRDLMTSHWSLAAAGEELRRRLEEVVRILKDMKARGILAPVDGKWLPIAEAELARLAP
jgi:hypothetical protein